MLFFNFRKHISSPLLFNLAPVSFLHALLYMNTYALGIFSKIVLELINWIDSVFLIHCK